MEHQGIQLVADIAKIIQNVIFVLAGAIFGFVLGSVLKQVGLYPETQQKTDLHHAESGTSTASNDSSTLPLASLLVAESITNNPDGIHHGQSAPEHTSGHGGGSHDHGAGFGGHVGGFDGGSICGGTDGGFAGDGGAALC